MLRIPNCLWEEICCPDPQEVGDGLQGLVEVHPCPLSPATPAGASCSLPLLYVAVASADYRTPPPQTHTHHTCLLMSKS